MVQDKTNIEMLFPKSIFNVLPERFFVEKDQKGHSCYIRSGTQYESYYATSKYYQPKKVLEIGVRLGYSMGSIIMGSDKIESIEGWDNQSYIKNSLTIVKENLKLLEKEFKLDLKQIDSQLKNKIENQYDLIHVDGDHTYTGVEHDLELTVGKCKVVIIDDYLFLKDVKMAVDDFVKKHTDIIEDHFLIDSYRGLYIIKWRS